MKRAREQGDPGERNMIVKNKEADGEVAAKIVKLRLETEYKSCPVSGREPKREEKK